MTFEEFAASKRTMSGAEFGARLVKTMAPSLFLGVTLIW